MNARTLKTYLELSKSGIVTLVLISVLSGYLVGHPAEIPLEPGRLAWTLIGILLLASGSSALNQLQDRAIDARMPRTAKRPLPSGRVSLRAGLAFVAVSVSVGLAVLFFQISFPAFLLGLFALVSYNGLYTLWWKRHWAFAAVPGAIPGALPILMGYQAASGHWLDPAGLYLFAILFYWQMPHFWVLALKYKEDYAAGDIPTLPVTKGDFITRKHLALWCLGYVGLSLLAPLFLHVGAWYFALAIPTTIKVLSELASYLKAPEEKKAWLRFFLWVNFSLILYLAAAVLDVWAMQLFGRFWI